MVVSDGLWEISICDKAGFIVAELKSILQPQKVVWRIRPIPGFSHIN